MLRVAVPNKGALSEPARQMLSEAGYLAGANLRDLVVADLANGVEFFFLRPRDIAIYVGSGTLDLGITGLDMLLDSGAEAREVMRLGFAPSTFRLAAPTGTVRSIQDLAGRRIATSYPGLLDEHLRRLGLEVTVVRLDGAVENAVALGVADAVADVVATGGTLRQAGLEPVGEPLLVSEALLVRRAGVGQDGEVATFVRRLQGVLTARTYVMVDYDIPAELVAAACRITPGIESPTVSPLADTNWSAVRAMVSRDKVHRVMDELYELGARGIIVTDIHACRL
ncbi:MAG: ATP phosphoribosyltransferase [Candidatus Nanopelagicales bacterium]|jgi:ATP phosphoribosyltransferase|nr:ATP phosphoribosyltransferase [Candidatus Nanopelagicales bacterium]